MKGLTVVKKCLQAFRLAMELRNTEHEKCTSNDRCDPKQYEFKSKPKFTNIFT